MAASIFDDKNSAPEMKSLSKALGSTFKVLESILGYIQSEFGDVVIDRKHYGKKSGWIMKCLLKKRNLFFLIPRENCFNLAFVFGDKAVAEVEKSDLPDKLISELVNARKYAEGRGLLLEISSDEKLEIVKTLLKIKVDN